MSNKFFYLFKKFFIFRFFIFLLTLGSIAAGILFIVSFTVRMPVITSVLPQVVESGSIIKIEGKHFGNKFNSSWVQIGDSIIQSENCDLWTEDKIEFKFPEYQSAGLLYVVVQNKKSNPSFLAAASEIPVIADRFILSEVPSINALSKDFAEVGSIIKIIGENFGGSRGNSQVMFIPNFTPDMISKIEKGEDVGASFCSNSDFDFITWTNEELQIRVPDGADSGAIAVLTSKGLSNAVPFRLKNRLGTKTRANKKNLVVAAEVDVSNIRAEEKNTLFLKVPLPVETYSQRGIEILSINPAPFVKNYQGASIHQYENSGSSTRLHIRQEYSVNSYEVTTKINPVNVRVGQKQNTALYNAYAIATEFIPANNEVIQKTAESIVQNEKNPYNKVKRIYNYLLNNLDIIPSSPLNSGSSLVNALTEKRADTYDAAILFVSLVRACGIPAQPVAGIIVDVSQTSYSHWWAEFYLEGFGWVPVDVGMAKAIPFDMGIPQKENWYFGNIDAFRVAFSYGKTLQTPMASNSKTAAKERSYSFSSSMEEFLGIVSYNSVWKVPKVIAVY
ncbi:transglutaminase domain-containing protein [Treponema pedis]|uniref:transglutaminase domain-containing protein n=1 Tax=Treponema pedis TaxID=409322 RepID=UPI0003F6AEF5|nr:transglutaminase domain-containing protein [Treponema pedis]